MTDADPFRLRDLAGQANDEMLDILAGAADLADTGRTAEELAAEVTAMARRLARGPLFLVHSDSLDAARQALDNLALLEGIDHRVDLKTSRFVPRNQVLIIPPETRAEIDDAGLDPATLRIIETPEESPNGPT